MKKFYECPEVEIKVLRLTDCILASTESKVNSEIHDFDDPIVSEVDDL